MHPLGKVLRLQVPCTHLICSTSNTVVHQLLKWWKDPLRRIPGPQPLPILGNVLSLKVEEMHMQLYHMAREYGPITKISILHVPVVILNSTELCMEALLRKGEDFQGRPPLPRAAQMVPKDLASMDYVHPEYYTLRKVATQGLKAYGTGVAHLERIMGETVMDVVDMIQGMDGQPVDTNKLSNGYICCVIASILFGEKYSYDDPICQSLHKMNDNFLKAMDPVGKGALLDMYPFLLNFKFLFPSTYYHIQETKRLSEELIVKRIAEAKASFNKDEKRGCLDYFIEAQQEVSSEEGRVELDGESIRGLVSDFVTGGMSTSLSSLSQLFLDLLHDPELQERMQAQIDHNIQPTHTITMADRLKLPLLEAYVHENLRYTSVAPFLLPHQTLRDTEIDGYKIPTGTRVLMNSFHASHNPEVYADPFKVNPDRFLDSDGNLVEPGHPMRQHSFGFGAGRRICPGESLARSRIFLFLAHILQKFTVEPVGELPERDVRKYKLGIIMNTPGVTAKFVRRQ